MSTLVAVTLPGATPSSWPGAMSPRDRPSITAASSPASSASTRWRRPSSIATTTSGTSAIGRPRALPATGAIGPPASGVAAPPSHNAAAIAARPAGSTYFSRARTVPPISAPCVPAEAIVVSEMGEMLSPNVAPPRMAPSSAPGCTPAPAAAGYSSGPQMSSVPKLVPVDVETTAQARNAAAA